MPDPLVQLDPSGKPTILGYNVPEPISYSGKNYIDLSLPPRAFVTPTAPHPASETDPSDAKPSVTLKEGATVAPVGARGSAGSDGQAMLHTAPVLSPPGVAIALSGSLPAVQTSLDTTDRLGALTGEQAKALTATGQLVVFPNTMGRLDYRVVSDGAALRPVGDGGGDGGGPDRPESDVSIAISSPVNGTNFVSDDSKLHVTVLGTWAAANVNNVQMTVAVDDGAPTLLTSSPDGSSWQAALDVTAAGSHTITAQITGTAHRRLSNLTYQIHDRSTVTVNVDLGAGGGSGATPSVAILEPSALSTVYSKGPTQIQILGKYASGSQDAPVATVRLEDALDGQSIPITVKPDPNGAGDWSISFQTSTPGRHFLTAIAVDSKGTSSQPATVQVNVLAEQPRLRTTSRLMLVETLNITSFLGEFGAGRCLKTISLLPGEKTTISVNTWTKTDESLKSGSSILDSASTDSETSWEKSLAQEQTSKEALTEATQYKISADASATWGWGHADVHGEYSGSANSTREGAVKNVLNALQKHSLKASTNRTVNINSEYTASVSQGEEQSTTREIANINVSRVLNIICRQMSQEHIILVHLTDVRIAFYAEDTMIDATTGKVEYVPRDKDHPNDLIPNVVSQYEEVSLADLQTLLDRFVDHDSHDSTVASIENALSGIPDYQSDLQTAFEIVVPKKADVQVPEATYIRFPRGLHMQFPKEDPQFEVPGIILAADKVVMRTDAVVCDAFLGEGLALDQYSQDLQQVSIDERRTKIAREQLAQKIVEQKDEVMAGLFTKVFPQQPLGMTMTTTTSSDGAKTGG